MWKKYFHKLRRDALGKVRYPINRGWKFSINKTLHYSKLVPTAIEIGFILQKIIIPRGKRYWQCFDDWWNIDIIFGLKDVKMEAEELIISFRIWFLILIPFISLQKNFYFYLYELIFSKLYVVLVIVW